MMIRSRVPAIRPDQATARSSMRYLSQEKGEAALLCEGPTSCCSHDPLSYGRTSLHGVGARSDFTLCCELFYQSLVDGVDIRAQHYANCRHVMRIQSIDHFAVPMVRGIIDPADFVGSLNNVISVQ
jgi:hypothetical protein